MDFVHSSIELTFQTPKGCGKYFVTWVSLAALKQSSWTFLSLPENAQHVVLQGLRPSFPLIMLHGKFFLSFLCCLDVSSWHQGKGFFSLNFSFTQWYEEFKKHTGFNPNSTSDINFLPLNMSFFTIVYLPWAQQHCRWIGYSELRHQRRDSPGMAPSGGDFPPQEPAPRGCFPSKKGMSRPVLLHCCTTGWPPHWDTPSNRQPPRREISQTAHAAVHPTLQLFHFEYRIWDFSCQQVRNVLFSLYFLLVFLSRYLSMALS